MECFLFCHSLSKHNNFISQNRGGFEVEFFDCTTHFFFFDLNYLFIHSFVAILVRKS